MLATFHVIFAVHELIFSLCDKKRHAHLRAPVTVKPTFGLECHCFDHKQQRQWLYSQHASRILVQRKLTFLLTGTQDVVPALSLTFITCTVYLRQWGMYIMWLVNMETEQQGNWFKSQIIITMSWHRTAEVSDPVTSSATDPTTPQVSNIVISSATDPTTL